MYMNEKMSNDFYKKHGNLFLTDKQVMILDKYGIDYKKFNSISELIYHLEYYLNSKVIDDLEMVSYELSELQYYNFTNK